MYTSRLHFWFDQNVKLEVKTSQKTALFRAIIPLKSKSQNAENEVFLKDKEHKLSPLAFIQ